MFKSGIDTGCATQWLIIFTCSAGGPWSAPRPRWLATSSVPRRELSQRSECCPARWDCLEVRHQSHRNPSQPGDLQRWQWSAEHCRVIKQSVNTSQGNSNTFTMAGSLGRPPCRVAWGFGGSHTRMSLMSDPRKMMYSYTSSLGATGLSVGRSSVPKERTEVRN